MNRTWKFLLLNPRNRAPQDSLIVPSNESHLSDLEDAVDSMDHGHENLTYVANEVAEVAASSLDEKRD